MKRITIALDPDLIVELDRLAAEANVSRSWMGGQIVRRTIQGLPMPALMTLLEHRPGEKVRATGSDIDVPVVGEASIKATAAQAKSALGRAAADSPVGPDRPARPDPKAAK